MAQTSTLLGVQYLRALAALMVVLVHAGEQAERFGASGVATEYGHAGVDIFFVISGFIMWVTTAGRPASPMAFMTRRVIRIVPLYWGVTLFVAAVSLAMPQLLSSTVFDPGFILGSMLFIPQEHPLFDRVWPFVIPGWTLNYEMAFYLLFAGGLFLPPRPRLAFVIGTLAAAALAGILLPLEGPLGFWTRPIILEFALGILIGVWFMSDRPSHARIGLVLFVSGLVLLVAAAPFEHVDRALRFGPPAGMIVLGVVMIEKVSPVGDWPVARKLGDASYSIYLTHIITVPAFAKGWSMVTGGAPAATMPLYWPAAMAASALVGLMTYELFERPVTRWLQQRFTRPKRAIGEASQPSIP